MPMHGGRTRERDDMKEVYYIKKFPIQGHSLQRKDAANKFLKNKRNYADTVCVRRNLNTFAIGKKGNV